VQSVTPYCAKQKNSRGEGLLPEQIRAKHMEKKGPNKNQRSSNGVKLYRHGQHILRGSTDKTWARMMSLGADQPMGSPAPLRAPFGLNFGQLALTTSPNIGCMCFTEVLARRMVVCSRYEGMQGSTTPLHLHHPSYDGLTQGLW
jgi:hypothetical protein